MLFAMSITSNGQHANVRNSLVGVNTNSLIRNGSGSGNSFNIDSLGDPSVFGDNIWNVYAWNSTGVDSWTLNYAGYYTDSILSMATNSVWDPDYSPSSAPNYIGDPVSDDNHSFSAKRRGFPTQYYSINIPGHDDYAYLLIDGVEVWNHEDCCDSHNDVWHGILNDTSTVEFRVMEFGGGSYGAIEFIQVPLVINVTSTSIPCVGGSSQVTVAATGGFPPYTGTGTFTVAPGNYSYTVTDNLGINAQTNYVVHEPPILDSSISLSNSSILCIGDVVDLVGPSHGSALSFNGNPQRVIIPFNSPETDYTYEIDFKTDQLNGGISSVRDGDIGASFDRELYLAGGDIFHRLFSEETIVSYGQNYADNQWHHVAVVVEAGEGQRIYVDGFLVAVGGMDHSDFNWDNTINVGFGNDWFSGSVDNMRIWNMVRSSTEIQQDQTSIISGNEPNLLASWSFDDLVGNETYSAVDNSVAYLVDGPTLVENNTNTYLWSNGETTRTITSTTSQDLSVTITTVNGCVATSEQASIVFNPMPSVPAISTTSQLSFCYGGNAELSSSTESNYQWNKNGNIIVYELDPDFIATTSGDYSVTVSNSFGCSQTSPITTVEVLPAPPVPNVTPSSSTTFCEGGSVLLTGQTGNVNIRYASSVLSYSSEYSAGGWGSVQLLGAPDVYPDYGDMPGAWTASNEDDPREFVELGFDNPIPISFIDIYETYKPGAIDTVYVKNPDNGLFEIVYTNTAAPAGDTARVLHITFPITSFDVSEIRISMDNSAVLDWNEIDAVKIGNELTSSFMWSNGDTTNSIYVTTSGDYSMTTSNSIGCTATSAPTTVTVNQTPVVSAGPDFYVGQCANLFQLTNGIPAGGTYSGNAVTSNMFDPAFGIGNFTVYYNYQDANGCVNYDEATITVQAAPVVTLGTFANVCSDANSITLMGGEPIGGIYSGPSVS